MVRFCGVVDPKDGDFPRSTIAYCTDAAFISVAALFGSSPVTAFIESGAGIAEGGRTGLTAIVTGLCFVIAVFFAPIFASIPPWATGCTLILVSITCFGVCFTLTLFLGWLHDDKANYADQLAVHWRCSPVVHCHDLYPFQLQCCIRPYCVRSLPGKSFSSDTNSSSEVFLFTRSSMASSAC